MRTMEDLNGSSKSLEVIGIENQKKKKLRKMFPAPTKDSTRTEAKERVNWVNLFDLLVWRVFLSRQTKIYQFVIRRKQNYTK